jgi:hypothetical protein
VTLVVLALSACGGDQQSEQGCEAPAEKSASTDPKDLWVDATKTTIGTTYGYTNRVELADINGDDLVDILFANGGTYEVPGKLDYSKVFLNQGPDNMFEGATRKVLPKADACASHQGMGCERGWLARYPGRHDLSDPEPPLSGRRLGQFHRRDENSPSPDQSQRW